MRNVVEIVRHQGPFDLCLRRKLCLPADLRIKLIVVKLAGA